MNKKSSRSRDDFFVAYKSYSCISIQKRQTMAEMPELNG